MNIQLLPIEGSSDMQLVQTWSDGTSSRIGVFSLKELLEIHHLTGGDCDGESCTCWARGKERGIEEQKENGRPAWA